MTGEGLGRNLGLHPRGICDFFDALVALDSSNEGNGRKALYSNTEETALHLDKNSAVYIGGILEMCNARLYKFWDDLGVALKTGQPQNKVKHSQKPIFETLYDEMPRLEQFIGAMTASRAEILSL